MKSGYEVKVMISRAVGVPAALQPPRESRWMGAETRNGPKLLIFIK